MVVPHPCILQTRGPCAHHIRPRLRVHITLLPFPGQTPPDEAAFHIGLPPRRGQTDRAHQSGPGTVFTDLYELPAGRLATLLPMAKFAYNNATNVTMGVSPFFTNKGYHPEFTADLQA